MSAPFVSILIPTWNGREDLERLLPALQGQVGLARFEIVALDSESGDGTQEVLRDHGVRFESLPQAEFGHGSARNRLAGMAEGDTLVFLSQDALPVGPDFVAKLVEPLADRRVAGTWARNVPHPDDDALTARSLLESGESSEASRRVGLEPGVVLADLEPAQRVALTRFNNVASAMRKDVHQQIPFPDVAFGEDSAWAARALSAGLELEYVAEAVVRHAHRYGPKSAFRRYEQDARFLREVHGLIVRPGLFSVAKGWLFEMRADWRFLRRRGGHWRDWARAPFLRLGQVLGQWRGSRP